MDHFQLGRTAFEARLFVEADTHFKSAESSIPIGEIILFRELQFACAKILRQQTCWEELFALADALANERAHEILLKLLDHEVSVIPSGQYGKVHQLRAEAFYQKGYLEQARLSAKQHVDHLLQKKLSARLKIASIKYQSWFPQSLYFAFIHFQSLVLLEDIHGSHEQFSMIWKSVHKKWAKVEDKKENSKSSLLGTLNDCAKNFDKNDGGAVLLCHRIYLHFQLVQKNKLSKDDWKKVVELAVQSDTWSTLKLTLELSIQNDEEAIALEAYAAMKRKRGFSFIKLTKQDPGLRDWLLHKGRARPQREPVISDQILLTIEDLALKENPHSEKITEQPFEIDPYDDELKSIEANAIKQLQFFRPGIELLPDLLVTYRMLGFQRVVGWLIDSFRNEPMRLELKKKVQYFSVLHAMDSKEYNLGLALVEEMLGAESLNLDEYKELKYAQGCLLSLVGRAAEARNSFKAVEKVDATYRQTKERMNKIAKD